MESMRLIMRACELLCIHGRRAGMDFLVVLGTSAAYFYSLLVMASEYVLGVAYHGHDFFETSAILITTVCLYVLGDVRAC